MLKNENIAPAVSMQDVRKAFGGNVVLAGISFRCNPGEAVCLIGPNGAGKSTILQLAAGLLYPDSGRVYFDGKDVTGMPAYKRARLGVSQVFQTARVVMDLSVRENVELAAGDRPWAIGEMTRLSAPDISEVSHDVLKTAGLLDRLDVKASQLSYGERRLLHIAAVLCRPSLLYLLDEPTTGLSTDGCITVSRLIQNLTNRGRAFVIVEHSIEFVSKLNARTLALEHGIISWEGLGADIAAGRRPA